MLGAIAGDIIGSVYESNNIKTKEFPLFDPRCHFTDDTVLTVALADAILNERVYSTLMKSYAARRLWRFLLSLGFVSQRSAIPQLWQRGCDANKSLWMGFRQAGRGTGEGTAVHRSDA